MSYIVFARKYRPQTFDDVVGQPHITTTLKNAIAQSRVAHAYLFAGPRGVGKTTTARVLAKALNCEKGPTPTPCNTCASCKEITQGSSLDILEIDGASNRGIEEIRSLRENAQFSPSKGRFKVYIIDEVHMLSGDAFNALLKTLEEPPPHLKFIFATTHPHKVPATILSRCQRFDFRRIATKDIADNLKAIANDEKLNIKDEALGLIARYSDGSLRDAQVILDQIASFTQGKVDSGDVAKILGIVDDEILFGLSAAISGRDPVRALTIIDRLMNDGKDVVQVILELIEHFRDISITKISAELDALIDAGPDKIKRYAAQGAHFTIEEILYIIYTLSNTIDFVRKSSLARIPFEAALVKLTRCGGILPVAEIMKRLEALESGTVDNKPSRPSGTASHQPLATSHEPRATSDQPPLSADLSFEAPGAKAEATSDERLATDDPPPPVSENGSNLDEILSSWTKVVNYIRGRKISVASYLGEGSPVSLEAGTLTISFPKEHQFHKEVLDTLDNRRLIEEGINKALGLEMRVILTLVEPARMNGRMPQASGGGTAGDLAAEGGAKPDESDPIVKAALEMFGGKIAVDKNAKGGKR